MLPPRPNGLGGVTNGLANGRSSVVLSFFDAPTVRLVYDDLNASAKYELSVVFNSMPEPIAAGSSSSSGRGGVSGGGGDSGNWISLMRLTATGAGTNGNNNTGTGAGAGTGAATGSEWGDAVQLWPPPPDTYQTAPSPMTVTTVAVPVAVTQGGRMAVACSQPAGLPGNGRSCQISAVWLRVVVGARDSGGEGE